MTTLLEKLLSLAAPNDCISCGKEDYIICSSCIPPLIDKPSQCYKCEGAVQDYANCGNCPAVLDGLFAIGAYRGELAELIKRLKYDGSRQVAADLAKTLAALIPASFCNIIVTAAPTSHARARQRGYDQAVLLAKQLAKQMRAPYVPLLIRQANTRQVGADRAKRFAQAENMFVVNPKFPLPKKVIIVDDVTTTGATLEAAAQKLRAAGAEQVFGAVLARRGLDD